MGAGSLRAEHGFAALLVTYDVDEALPLADVHIVEDTAVPMPYPRAPDDPGFAVLRRHLLDRLGVPVG